MIDLYALTSPNVQKIFIMLEEITLDRAAPPGARPPQRSGEATRLAQTRSRRGPRWARTRRRPPFHRRTRRPILG